jgi:hemerythrin-like domain-containing protein
LYEFSSFSSLLFCHIVDLPLTTFQGIIRAINSIYIQAPHVPPSSHKSFVSYCIATYEGLMAHHDGEEDFLFPEMERLTGEKGLMDANISQHEKFHSGLESWIEYLRNVQQNPNSNTFSGEKCRALMNAFIDPLSTHLADEIPTLLSLSRFGDSLNLADLLKREGEKVMGGLSKTNQLPLFWVNHDAEFEGGIHNFPPVPPPVRWVLFQVFGRWQRDWWKFGCVGYDGRGRELLFVGEEEH